MEKLLDLLNEYDGTPNERKLVGDKLYLDGLNVNSELFECLIVSKYYGFIQRLVKNNKIDITKVGKLSNMGFGDKYDRVETVLMLLSIQESPIEFLISILR